MDLMKHSLFVQDIDIDSHYRTYSMATRKSLEAWSGSLLDLGLVKLCLYCQHDFLLLCSSICTVTDPSLVKN